MGQKKTRKVILAMQMTLDGFIEGPNGEMDWLLGGDDEWEAILSDLQSVDTFLLGRKMYPGYSEYWRHVLTDPAANKYELEFARLADRTPHIVFSRSLSTVDWANTRIAKDAAKEISDLKNQPGKDIVLWGGAGMASSLINLGLIDEYRITLNPTLLGAGKSLFSNLSEKRKLKLVEARPLRSGATVLRYAS